MKLKTRTNQPVYYKLPVSSNIEQLSDNLLNSLRVGDVVQKKTGNQKHCYIVTYKEEKHGICLSYFDGSGYMETISYDYVGGHWVYNSKDVADVSPSGILSTLQDKDLKVKTLEQSEANWSVDITSFPNITGGTSSAIFCRVQQINKELHIIFMGKIENTTESPITGYLTNDITIDLPEYIANKIYDVLGNKASETPNDDTRISGDIAFASINTTTNTQADVFMLVMNKTLANRISVRFSKPAGFSIGAGQTLYLESRVSLDLI